MKGSNVRNRKNIRILFQTLVLGGTFYVLLKLGLTMEAGKSFPDTVKAMIRNFSVLWFFATLAAAFGLVLLTLYLRRTGKLQTFGEKIYRFRYLIGGLFLVFCVILRISGSSLASWDDILLSGKDSGGLLFGIPRVTRSDEYATLLPMTLSQYADPFGRFSYFSHIVRGTSTDVFIEYGTPVRDLAVLFRPFHWGYLFLSPERGLSFFWCSRFILLFLVSFDLGTALSGNRTLGFVLGLFTLFSPLIQWWFAINGLVEMFIFGEGGVLLFRQLLKTENRAAKGLCSLGIALCIGGYVLTLYPAWMVTFGYVVLGLLLSVLLKTPKAVRNLRRWVFYLLFSLALAGAGLLYVYGRSGDTIRAIMNTVYPGHRIQTGGGYFWKIFQYSGNFFGGLSEFPNVCEFATFFSMAPLGSLLAACSLLLHRSRRKDPFVWIFGGLTLWFLLYAVIPFPEKLLKLSLFSFCTGGRVTQLSGITDLFLLLRVLPDFCLKERKDRFGMGGALLLYVPFILKATEHEYSWVLSPVYVIAMMILVSLTAVLLLLLRWRPFRGISLFGLSVLLLVTGGYVNPVQVGAPAIYEQSLYSEIADITEQNPETLWLGEGVWLGDYVITAGGKALNSTNVYPNTELWEKLDPAGEEQEIWNRYAHINVTITEGEFSMSLLQDDVIDLKLTPEELRLLGVDYLLTLNDLSERLMEGSGMVLFDHEDSWYIYRVEE